MIRPVRLIDYDIAAHRFVFENTRDFLSPADDLRLRCYMIETMLSPNFLVSRAKLLILLHIKAKILFCLF